MHSLCYRQLSLAGVGSLPILQPTNRFIHQQARPIMNSRVPFSMIYKYYKISIITLSSPKRTNRNFRYPCLFQQSYISQHFNKSLKHVSIFPSNIMRFSQLILRCIQVPYYHIFHCSHRRDDIFSVISRLSLIVICHSFPDTNTSLFAPFFVPLGSFHVMKFFSLAIRQSSQV